jgi:hypothetical protein
MQGGQPALILHDDGQQLVGVLGLRRLDPAADQCRAAVFRVGQLAGVKLKIGGELLRVAAEYLIKIFVFRCLDTLHLDGRRPPDHEIMRQAQHEGNEKQCSHESQAVARRRRPRCCAGRKDSEMRPYQNWLPQAEDDTA